MVSRPPSTKSSVTLPAHHANNSGTLFKNPWPSAEKPTWSELLTMSNPLSWYNSHDLHKHEKAQKIEVVKPDWGVSSLKEQGLEKENCIIGTWLGHAGAMVELPVQGVKGSGTSTPSGTRVREGLVESRARSSLWFLFDPIFSMRAGPTQYTGPSRMKPSPCQVADLPACDAVFISHNHYDHLDLFTIKAIVAKFPKCRYFVPLGNKSWLSSTAISKDLVFELDWWSDLEFSLDDFDFDTESTNSEDTTIRITCVPAQHKSGRGTMDQFTTLWNGWVIESFLTPNTTPKTPSQNPPSPTKTRHASIYHAGDTGYRRTAKALDICPISAEIGTKLGPFDLSFIPIWRGGTLGFISYLGLRLSHQEIPSSMHTSPRDAIDIHKDVGSRNTVGVHFGTFVGSENETFEAGIEFHEAREELGVERLGESGECEKGRAGLLNIGGSVAVEIEGR